MESSGVEAGSAKLPFLIFRSYQGPIDMLILQGGQALSSFRIQSLISRANAAGIALKNLTCTYLFFVTGECMTLQNWNSSSMHHRSPWVQGWSHCLVLGRPHHGVQRQQRSRKTVDLKQSSGSSAECTLWSKAKYQRPTRYC